jgi:hypothetical protein
MNNDEANELLSCLDNISVTYYSGMESIFQKACSGKTKNIVQLIHDKDTAVLKLKFVRILHNGPVSITIASKIADSIKTFQKLKTPTEHDRQQLVDLIAPFEAIVYTNSEELANTVYRETEAEYLEILRNPKDTALLRAYYKCVQSLTKTGNANTLIDALYKMDAYVQKKCAQKK